MVIKINDRRHRKIAKRRQYDPNEYDDTALMSWLQKDKENYVEWLNKRKKQK